MMTITRRIIEHQFTEILLIVSYRVLLFMKAVANQFIICYNFSISKAGPGIP